MTGWELAAQAAPAIVLSLIVLALAACNIWKRWVRHLNIRAAGWPPAHCDADGDVFSPVIYDEEE